MESGLQTEIQKIALGYGLEYKISNYRMQSYLAPAYVVLQRKHPGLSFQTFINEVLRIRAERERKIWSVRMRLQVARSQSLSG